MKTARMLGIMAVGFCLVNSAMAGWVTSGNDMYSDVTGNVGIGTTTPAYKLHLVGKGPRDGIWFSASPAGTDVALLNNVGFGSFNSLAQAGDSMILLTKSKIDDPSAGGLVLGPWSAGETGVRITPTGNVGIGTASPNEKLTVSEKKTIDYRLPSAHPERTVNQDSVVRGELDWTIRPYRFPWESDRTAQSNGQLGSCQIDDRWIGNVYHRIIGVYGESRSDSDTIIGYGGYFVAEGENGVGVYAKGGPDGCAGKFDGNVVISTGKTVTPVLEITGGSDVSEQFEIHRTAPGGEPAPGMVVSIDPDRPGDLMVSSKAYDRKVAGIISGAGGVKPGMLMGQKGTKADGQSPVAMTGRVYCWTDASYGAIEPGDLLTTSDTTGCAMKVTEYNRAQGAIIGKAMSSLESGRGLVLVLVTLQ